MKELVMIRYEEGTDVRRCTELLKAHASTLMAAADVNLERIGMHKAHLPLPEEGLILCCAGRKQAEAEGIAFDNEGSYLLIAWSWDGPIGRCLRKHYENDPDAIRVPYPPQGQIGVPDQEGEKPPPLPPLPEWADKWGEAIGWPKKLRGWLGND
jgi:hypothetical protein